MAAIIFAVRKRDEEKRQRAIDRSRSGRLEVGNGSSAMANPSQSGVASPERTAAASTAPSDRSAASATSTRVNVSERTTAPMNLEVEDLMPAWAKTCECWRTFWARTSMDEHFWAFQPRASEFYNSKRCQVSVAVLIFANFIANVIEKEIDPGGDSHKGTFEVFEYTFNIAFTIELVVNMYAHWFWKFWLSSWNLFDFFIVGVGLLSMMGLIGGNLTMLRTLRAFRVFRLFKRVKALNKILQALTRSVPGVSHAFSVVLLVMSIYAILGVEFFLNFDKGGTYINQENLTVELITPRMYNYGDEYFGTFCRALFTLFQVLTGESWAEVVARPLLFGVNEAPFGVVGAAIYFLSYVLVASFVLINLVVAVLLDKMVAEPEPDGHPPKDPTFDLLERIYAEQMRQADVIDTLSRRQKRVERALTDAGMTTTKPKLSDVSEKAFGRLGRELPDQESADGNHLASVSELSEAVDERSLPSGRESTAGASLVRVDSKTEVSSAADSPLPSGRASSAEVEGRAEI